jgi:hypothetical protein
MMVKLPQKHFWRRGASELQCDQLRRPTFKGDLGGARLASFHMLNPDRTFARRVRPNCDIIRSERAGTVCNEAADPEMAVDADIGGPWPF